MRIVIIGGDAAGMTAAMEIVRSKVEAKITVLEKGDIYSYGQCGLPYVLGGSIQTTEKLIAKPVTVFREKYGIDARIEHEVQHVDSEAQTVQGTNLATGEQFEIAYDKLLIATGGSSFLPNWENSTLSGIHRIKTIPQMEMLLADAKHIKHVTVIGGGAVGLETVEALRSRGLQVRLLHQAKQLMQHLHPSISGKIYEEALKHEVEVCLEQEVVAFEGDERVTAVRTKTDLFKTDLVIAATGIRPNTQMLDGAKLENGALIVNDKMQTSIPNVYAAGDCASHFHRLLKSQVYIALGTTANKQGRIAGQQMSGNDIRFGGILGTQILKFFELTIGATGIKADQHYEFTANHIAGYYPAAQPIHLIVYTTKDGQLQGLQVIGKAGVDKRVDVFATALYNGMTLAQLTELDLSYSPPYNSVWDPLLQVAKRYS